VNDGSAKSAHGFIAPAELQYVLEHHVEPQDYLGRQRIDYRMVEIAAALDTKQRGQDPSRAVPFLALVPRPVAIPARLAQWQSAAAGLAASVRRDAES